MLFSRINIIDKYSKKRFTRYSAMINEEIRQYIIAARLKNMSDSDIKDQLIKAGWELGDVMKTFDAIGTDGVPVPSPHVSGHFGMWATFLYILLFISLYALATSVGIILHAAVDKNIPDVIDTMDYSAYYTTYLTSDWYVNFAKASIIVSYPIFAILLYLLGRQAVSQPQIRNLRGRKILIYISLVVTFLIMITSIIATLYGYLNDGMLAQRTLLHTLVTLVLSGGIFSALLYIVRKDKKIV